MYNVLSIKSEAAAVCVKMCRDGAEFSRQMSAIVMFCQPLAAQTVALCLQIHKSECVV